MNSAHFELPPLSCLVVLCDRTFSVWQQLFPEHPHFAWWSTIPVAMPCPFHAVNAQLMTIARLTALMKGRNNWNANKKETQARQVWERYDIPGLVPLALFMFGANFIKAASFAVALMPQGIMCHSQ
ncbi:hypothetical protein EBB07_19265 [Paenibacillaceae bacterium]|nr:hypothetical protein EBB07_19265 [Paenibacillaceae bacterium]